MSEMNDTSNESSSHDSILQASRLTGGTNKKTVRPCNVLRPSLLGPSVLSTASNNSGEDSVGNEKPKEPINNPFLKEVELEEIVENPTGTDAEVPDIKETSETDTKKTYEDEEPDGRPDPLSLLRKNGLERSNLFAAAKNSMPRVEKSGFVFGQNVRERVENVNAECSSKSENSNTDTVSGELLFASVIQNAAKSSEGEASGVKETETKSLNDVAREYEESRAQKRKFEEVETFTGEENESNIVDINCKLFAFVNSNWEERGRGSMRLNDAKNMPMCSRVVFRTSGNLRLLLNTKVWAGMVAERPSQKSLRLTAMDNTGKIKIFLVMARPVDINLMHKALVERIDYVKLNADSSEEPTNGATNYSAEATAAAADVIEPEMDDAAEPSPKKQPEVN